MGNKYIIDKYYDETKMRAPTETTCCSFNSLYKNRISRRCFRCGSFYLLVLLNLLVAAYYVFICRIFYYCALRVSYNICN